MSGQRSADAGGIKVNSSFYFSAEERRQIGRRDGKSGPARRSDLRDFISQAIGYTLAGEWGWQQDGGDRTILDNFDQTHVSDSPHPCPPGCLGHQDTNESERAHAG